MKNLNTAQGMTTLPAHAKQARTLDHVKSVKRVCAYAMLAMLSGYAVHLMNSAGDISAQENNVIVVASTLTLLVIIPIIVLSIYFVSRYHAPSTTAEYSSPDSHSIKKEAMAWAAPLAIIAVLIFLGWGAIHSLELYKPIESKVAPERVATVAGA